MCFHLGLVEFLFVFLACPLHEQDKYEEIKSVGKGSFGDVWLVRRKKDDRQFVLKKMHVGKTEKEVWKEYWEIVVLRIGGRLDGSPRIMAVG
jgi:hypothetical protein